MASNSVVYFTATWSDVCTHADAVFEALKAKYPGINFQKVDADQIDDPFVQQYKPEIVPSFVVLEAGKLVNRIEGFDPAGISAAIEKLRSPEESQKELATRLTALINSHQVMLFMKGNPEGPRCGFSRQIVEILKNEGVEFSSFDILSDQDVREGLKKLSDWPTYPQLYVKGELVGGLDIVKQLVADGEFAQTVKG